MPTPSEKPPVDNRKLMVPAVLVGLAGLIEIGVALATEGQTAAIIGVALVIAAVSLFLQARRRPNE